jgi:small nuclear ribonucleoprotein B and B'
MPPKIQNWLNYRVSITLHDGRRLVGQFLAYDRHMNIVISECEEYRKIKDKAGSGEEREVKRMLGLLLLRGESVNSLTPEAPPSSQAGKVGQGSSGLLGKAVPVGRGAGGFIPQTGLTAPVRGVGGPAPMGFPPGMIPPGAFR